jgi:DNA-binding LacI/PurR family transcriptional regulator
MSSDQRVPIRLPDEGFPTVVLGDHFEHPNLAYAFSESRRASVEGKENPISRGQERIAFAVNDIDDGDHLDHYEAYSDALIVNSLSAKMRDPIETVESFDGVVGMSDGKRSVL